MDVVWDMETGDPDDFITLLWLLGHPEINLLGVLVTPGGADQVGVVRWALRQFGKEDLPVGTFHDPAQLERDDVKQHGEPKSRVSAWHYKTFGNIEKSYDALDGPTLLYGLLGPMTTLVTGGPLKNLGEFIRRHEESARPVHSLGRLFVQGGFAGVGVVPEDKQLEKFKGKVTCPTYNLNGDPKAALRLIEHAGWFDDVRFVSKNVCHGVHYDAEMHAAFTAAIQCTHRVCDCPCHVEGGMHIDACCDGPCPICGENEAFGGGTRTQTAHDVSLDLIHTGMGAYLGKHKDGKKFHDPLAAACALRPEIGQWERVTLYRERGEWGAFKDEDSPCCIIVGYDHDLFVKTLVGRS